MRFATAVILASWLAACVAPQPQLSQIGASGPAVEIAEPAFLPQDHYPTAEALIAAIRSQGLVPLAMHASRQAPEVMAQVRTGQPVLVRIERGFPFFTHLDYVAVVGVDAPNNRVLLCDANHAAQWMNFGDFVAAWRGGGDWALAAAPPQRIPSFATADEWLAGAAALEPNQPEAATQAYLAATQHWPYLASAWLALGRMREMRGDLSDAILAYAAAARVQPLDAATHARLAQLLLARQCADQAEDEIDQALRYETDPQRRAEDQRLLAQIRSHGGPSVVCPLQAESRY